MKTLMTCDIYDIYLWRKRSAKNNLWTSIEYLSTLWRGVARVTQVREAMVATNSIFEDFFEIWFWKQVETMVVGLKTFFVNQRSQLSRGWLGQVQRKQAWPFLHPASTWMVLYNINRYVYYNTIGNMICCTQRKCPSQYKKGGGNHIITIGNHDLGLPAEKAVEN